ncbi:NUDIX hydrolase [Pseudanabaena minima]|uniref:NUDIX hydrolase n=1 Tax=Pseudanabaena minima TaxID=890415 RepID=UPI003DA8B807
MLIYLFRNGNKILVSECFDSIKQDYFCRPLGGGIEFGESSQEAMLREIGEELALEIENLKLIEVIENIFVYEGKQGHEVVFVYDAKFVDKSCYDKEVLTYYESSITTELTAKWLSLADMQQQNIRLVPEGLKSLLFA